LTQKCRTTRNNDLKIGEKGDVGLGVTVGLKIAKHRNRNRENYRNQVGR
jgi:hypothetical protein